MIYIEHACRGNQMQLFQNSRHDLCCLAFILLQKPLILLFDGLLMQIHDELVFEAPNSEADKVKAAIPKLMTEVATLAVPLLVEIGAGPNWETAH